MTPPDAGQRAIPSFLHLLRDRSCRWENRRSSPCALLPSDSSGKARHRRSLGDALRCLCGASFVLSVVSLPVFGSALSPLTLSLEGHISASTERMSGVRISINGGVISVAPTSSGRFILPPLPAGSYLLQPSHPRLVFPSYLLKILPTGASTKASPGGVSPARTLTAQVFLLGDSFRPLNPASPLPAPLRIEPAPGTPDYFIVKPPFNLFFLLQQPILLVGAFCCALMWCLPKLQQYQEEEERQQRLLARQQTAAGCLSDGRDAGRRELSPFHHSSVSGELDDEGVPETSAFRKGLLALREESRIPVR